MPFQAITNAPTLRDGATLNVMAVPQNASSMPARLSAGVWVTLRLGNCCPRVKEGRIASADADHAILTLDGIDWRLQHRSTGVSIPGIVSEDWIVLHRAA